MTWIAARGALTGSVSKVHSSYHIPISNTAAASMVLENQAPAAAAGPRGVTRNSTDPHS